MAEMGRRTDCSLCGNDASMRRPRYSLRAYKRGESTASRGRSAAYICNVCGDALTSGDTIRLINRLADVATGVAP